MKKQSFEQCEREPLHLSGAIQPHGTLLIVDRHGRISNVAANVAQFLGAPPSRWLGSALPSELAGLVSALALAPGSRKAWIGLPDRDHGLLDVVASRGESGTAVLEMTRHQLDSTQPRSAPRIPLAAPIESDAELAVARETLTERIAELTGFHRVMYYAFREDGDGEVIAEARCREVYGSYLGLRFPASDIPMIARRLYLKNPWRSIPDNLAEPVAVLAHDGQTPDLTWSDLRSVSLMHRVYLSNMRVRASLSFPVVTGGELTALLAAHHRETRQLSVALLEYAAALVRSHAVAVLAYQSGRYMRLLEGLTQRFENVRDLLHRHHGDLPGAWPELARWLMDEFQTDGATLCCRQTCMGAGHTFAPDALAAFDDWFCKQQHDAVWAGDSLSRQVPNYPASDIAGALALRIDNGGSENLRLYLTRIEHIDKVTWGGNPEKPVESHDGVLNIAPRHSFDKWVEKRTGYGHGWDKEASLLAIKLGGLLHREIRC